MITALCILGIIFAAIAIVGGVLAICDATGPSWSNHISRWWIPVAVLVILLGFIAFVKSVVWLSEGTQREIRDTYHVTNVEPEYGSDRVFYTREDGVDCVADYVRGELLREECE